MKGVIGTVGSILFSLSCMAQNAFKGIIKEDSTQQPLAGVSVSIEGRSQMTVTNDSGLFVFTNLPSGRYSFHSSHVNYTDQTITATIPDSAIHVFFLHRKTKELEDITIISTTRNNQWIENAPLKVEVLGKEEMDEENTIRPANIASILGDVSGIQIQQSSAVSGNANVRIQGLEGRYTQILRDGMPLFDGFSGNFGILSIPPLDLRQIELVKGSASTLYGGGAIGGLINLISKRPSASGEAILTLNQTTLKETDANVYLSKRHNWIGTSFFSGYVHQGAADVNHDDLTDVPHLKSFIIHPRLFFYPDSRTTITTGYTGTFEKRTGGDSWVLDGTKDNLHRFYETNRTSRNTGELIAERNFTHNIHGTLKASVSNFDRTIETNTYLFKGAQFNYFTEASVLIPTEKMDWVAGINSLGDRFTKKPSEPVDLENFSNNTVGAFVQNTWRIPSRTVLETGLRVDHHDQYGTFVLPRLALFHRFSEQWASRLGFGMGYKTPNPLAPQNVDYDIRDLQPIAPGTRAEKSYGFNAEGNFKKEFGKENSVFINQAFFLTTLTSPIIATEEANGDVAFSNQSQSIVSKGFDTYAQIVLNGWEIYAGYTFTIAERNYLPQNKFVPLTPKNRSAFTVVKEIGEQWRFGLEGSYTGGQFRDNDTKTPGYFFMAAMLQRNIGSHIALVLNCENLLDYRQSRHEALYTGTITDPQFKPLWAPIDGRVANFSVRIKK
jgi:iron complex outermembrane receptor protein/outer membrane receptor for ferrienterochelin and colicins